MGTKNYSYYSNVLQKPFDTLDKLSAAEKAYFDDKKKKEDAAAEKKSDAKIVEECYKNLNTAKAKYNVDVDDAAKECAKIIADARLACNEKITKAEELVNIAETAYTEAIKEFTAKHPEGYHVTLRDGDHVTTISHTAHDQIVSDFYKTILKLF